MVILRSQNKITDFLMILAWACCFNVFKNTSFFISTPENVYLDKNMSMLGRLEAAILTRVLKWPPLESICFWSLKNILFCYKWPSKYTFRHRYSDYLWIRS